MQTSASISSRRISTPFIDALKLYALSVRPVGVKMALENSLTEVRLYFLKKSSPVILFVSLYYAYYSFRSLKDASKLLNNNPFTITGMNVARFNFSHGDHSSHQSVLDRLRKVAASKSRNIAGEYNHDVLCLCVRVCLIASLLLALSLFSEL